MHTLKNVIYADIQHKLDPWMGGIRKGDLAAAWTSRTNVLLAKSKEWGLPVAVAFLDISRAFASVDHPFLFRALHAMNIDPVWLRY